MVKSNNVIRFPYLNEYQRRQIAYRRKHTSRFCSYIPSEGDFKVINIKDIRGTLNRYQWALDLYRRGKLQEKPRLDGLYLVRDVSFTEEDMGEIFSLVEKVFQKLENNDFDSKIEEAMDSQFFDDNVVEELTNEQWDKINKIIEDFFDSEE